MDEHTGQTRKIARPDYGRKSPPLGTIFMLVVLAAAAGTAGFLLSPRVQPSAPAAPASADSVPAATDNKREPAAAPSPEVPVPEPPPQDPPLVAQPEKGEGQKRTSTAKKPRTTSLVAPSPTPTPPPPPVASAPTEPVPVPVVSAPFDRAAADGAMQRAASAAGQACSQPGEPNGSGIVWLTFVPTGKAVGVSLKGPLSGTSTGLCVLRNFFKVTVPAFAGEPVPVSREVRIP